jgi:hypothetical protein
VRLPWWLHRRYAWAAGYFWLPCPVCGREFGGHERGAGVIPDFARDWPMAGLVACPRCVATEPQPIRMVPVSVPHPVDAQHPPTDFDG